MENPLRKEENFTVGLHVHSMFSLNDSIIRPEELVERLKEIGQTASAITDHGNLYAGVSIYKLFKDNDIKYIHGIEFYVCDDVTVKDKNNPYSHLLVLCKNEQGRLNINKLVSFSERPENSYFKPRIDFRTLSENGDGLIVCSACMAGEISKALRKNDTDKAKELALKYKERFGEDFYIEIQSHEDTEQIELNKQLVSLANELEIPIVVTTDAHYVRPEDQMYQNTYAFNGKYKEDGEAYTDCYIQSEEEVRAKLSYLPEETVNEAILNTHRIADKCNVELPLSAPIMPAVDTPPQFKDNVSYLRSLCEDGCKKKLGFDINTGEIPVGYPVNADSCPIPVTERIVYRKRYEYELDALTRMGFIDYILLVYSYANVGKRRGKGRGSGGGSIVNYLTNITDIDPIEHELFFERFVDVSALDDLAQGKITAKELKIPDIDLDFSGEDCKKVLQWMYDKYGESRVASIGKFGTNKTKGAIRDICKTMGIDLAAADMIAKSFGEYQIDDLDAIIESGEKIPDSLRDAYGFVQKYPKLFDYVRKLSGLPKSFGLHACGKVIATRDLDYYLPSCYDASGIRYLQGDMHDVEDVGLVKVDVLGLRTLDHEYDALELSENGEEFINPKQKYDDEKVWDVFRSGDTTGIFQFSSAGMKQTLKKMEVSSIDELSTANALFRPGAMAHIDDYCMRKSGREEVTYYHPDLEPILKGTYGVIVFQEQLIQIARLAKMRNPDILRKMVGKKSTALIPVVKPELHDGLIARGWTEEQFDTLWEVILASCSYMFNKSHSSAYAILAYMTAKIKAYYPAAFFAGLLSSYIGSGNFKDDREEIFTDMAKHKVMFAPLSFRNDHRRCVLLDGKITYAIPLIRDMNTEIAEILYRHKDYQGTFSNLLKTLYDEGLRKATFSSLITLGFFSEFGTIPQLNMILSTWEFLNWGERTQIMKKTAEKQAELCRIIERYSTDIGANGKPIAKYMNIDTSAVVREYEQAVMGNITSDLGMKVKVVNQKEMLGVAPFPTGREEDRSMLFVTKVSPLINHKTGSQFGMSVFTTSFGSGIQSRFTVKGKQYREWETNPIHENDIIRCLSHERQGQYFNLLSWKQIY